MKKEIQEAKDNMLMVYQANYLLNEDLPIIFK